MMRRARHRRLSPVSLAATWLALVTPPACVSERPEPTRPPGDGDPTLAIRDFAFVPSDVTIRRGARLVWTNDDAVLHTVTADDGSFDSSTFGQGQTFALTPERAGIFPYFCEIHPFMRGTLRVTE